MHSFASAPPVPKQTHGCWLQVVRVVEMKYAVYHHAQSFLQENPRGWALHTKKLNHYFCNHSITYNNDHRFLPWFVELFGFSEELSSKRTLPLRSRSRVRFICSSCGRQRLRARYPRATIYTIWIHCVSFKTVQHSYFFVCVFTRSRTWLDAN